MMITCLLLVAFFLPVTGNKFNLFLFIMMNFFAIPRVKACTELNHNLSKKVETLEKQNK